MVFLLRFEFHIEDGNVIVESHKLQLRFNYFMNKQNQEVIYKLKKITIISGVFMLVQILGGYYAHSIAILADAFHLFSDVLAYMISLYAVYKSTQISPPHLTFGYDKIQPLGALLNVAIIWIVTAQLFIEATKRIIMNSIVQQPSYMLVTSIFGLGCNLYILQILHSDEHAGHHNCGHNHHHSSSTAVGTNKNSQLHKHQNCHHKHHHHEYDLSPVHTKLCKGQEHDHSHSHSHNHSQHCGHNHVFQREQQKSISVIESLSDMITPNSRLQQAILQNKSYCCEHQMSFNSCDSKVPIIPTETSDQDQNKQEKKYSLKNINMEAAYIHILTDIILSVGVIISASVLCFFAPSGWSNWQLVDPLCTYLFSFMAIYSTVSITKESIVLLLDGCEHPEFIPQIRSQLKEDSVVKQIMDLRVWSSNRGKHFGLLKVKVAKGDLHGVRNVFSSRGITGFIELVEEQKGSVVQQ